MKIEIDQPGFIIFGPIPTPKPVPPPPPPRKEPSDDFLSRHSQRSLRYAAFRPVIKDGEPTGEWLVSLISPDELLGGKWIVKPNQDEAYDWCVRADKVMRQKMFDV